MTRPKQSPKHPWVAAGIARLHYRKRIRREIAEAIARMRRERG